MGQSGISTQVPKDVLPRSVTLVMLGLQVTLAALLLADLTFLWYLRGLTRSQWLLFAGAAVWLVVCVLVGFWRGSRYHGKFEKALVCLTSLLISFAFIELGLRLFTPGDTGASGYSNDSRYLYRPHTRSILSSDDALRPGIQKSFSFTTNEWGLRGPSVKVLSGKPNVFKVITVGGSTTICWSLDDSTEWSHLLMEGLNSKQKQKFVYVANAGINGHNTADHLELLRRFPIVREADLLIFLIGVNDLLATLALEGRASQSKLVERASSLSFESPPRYPFYLRLRVIALLKRILPTHGPRLVNGPKWYTQHLRAVSPVVRMPDLNIGLEGYRMRVQQLAESCTSAGQRCLFLTQPTMWRSNLTPQEESLMFLGWTGQAEHPKGFVRTSDPAGAINQFNQSLLEVCKSKSLECYDLASAIPKDTTVFWDDCHFTENGASLVAKLLVDRLLKTAPFSN